ncbi:MAG TPA: HlyD family efflux transporter periplasmic adaptor subunit [Caulobacteraceae bacterium]|nr:HlyD family efflux transporter periplasmic adaptor subunit [Caulobacteraceae bacterium]
MDARTETNVSYSTAAVSNGGNGGASRRRQLFTILGVVVLLGAIAFGAYYILVASHHVKTDDAYVEADTASVTALVSGPVTAAPSTDTQVVKTGDVLVQIDPADYRLALEQAQAQLGQAERQVKGDFATAAAQTANASARDADIIAARARVESANADLARARTDLTRREKLAPQGAVSGDELTSAQNKFEEAKASAAQAQAALTQAQANRTAAIGQANAASAIVAGAGVEDNPAVAVARARVDQAKLDLDRTTIRAPVDGVIAKNVVEVGQRVNAGAQLMTVVPIQAAYVNANFKEGQLRKVRQGQSVVLTSDLYGKGVKFHGKIVGVSGGTGSAFAVIPAQNATGNWIKVVQRLPVRVALDPKELKAHPLRVGLSMDVDIDTAAH